MSAAYVPYASARAGEAVLVAPACASTYEGDGVNVMANGQWMGFVSDFVRFRIPPPRLLVTATPDTLTAGAASALTVRAVHADGTEAPWPSDATVTLTAGASVGWLVAGPVSGPSVTVSYTTARAGGVSFQAAAQAPEEDAGVTLAAQSVTPDGRQAEGSGGLVVLATGALRLTAAPDSIAAGGVSSLSVSFTGAAAQAVAPSAGLSFVLDAPSLGVLWRSDTDERGATLTGVPRSLAESGGVRFEAAGRDTTVTPPPALARGGVSLAGGDSAAADSVWARARIRAWVEADPTLADTATVAVGGRSRLSLVAECAVVDGRTRCTLRVTAPDGCASVGAPDVRLRLSGVRGLLLRLDTNDSLRVDESDAEWTVPYAAASSGQLVFVPEAGATLPLRLGEAEASFTAVVRDCDGEPVQPGTVAVSSGPLPPTISDGGGGDENRMTVRLIRQDDRPVEGGYVMVSKVRPDWLLVGGEEPFQSQYGVLTFENVGVPDPAVHFDRDTYRVEVVSIPESLASEEAGERFRFMYEVIRSGQVVFSTTPASRAAEGQGDAAKSSYDASIGEDSAGTLSARAREFIRLVSNGEPANGAAGNCSPWPPAEAGSPAPGGACTYDDDVAGDQTILVRLNDHFRVTAYVEQTDGSPADTLGRVELPVGQPATQSSSDAVRRVDLVWHEYVQADGTRLGSNPVVSAVRMSEDWAQASIYFSNIGTAQPFSTAELTTVIEVEASAPAPTGGDITLVAWRNSGTPDTLTVGYAAGDTGYVIAQKVAGSLASVAGGSADWYHGGSFDRIGYAVVNRALVDSVTVVSSSDPGVLVSQLLEELEFARSGSEAASVAGWAVADSDRTTADVFVVPRIAIQQGDPASRTLAYALPSLEPRLFVTPEVAVGNDAVRPHVLGHEVGHLLLVGSLPGSGGGPECDPPAQQPSHHPASYNLMFCVAMEQGELVGGPKRLTRSQQGETRNESAGTDGSPTGLLKGP